MLVRSTRRSAVDPLGEIIGSEGIKNARQRVKVGGQRKEKEDGVAVKNVS